MAGRWPAVNVLIRTDGTCGPCHTPKVMGESQQLGGQGVGGSRKASSTRPGLRAFRELPRNMSPPGTRSSPHRLTPPGTLAEKRALARTRNRPPQWNLYTDSVLIGAQPHLRFRNSATKSKLPCRYYFSYNPMPKSLIWGLGTLN